VTKGSHIKNNFELIIINSIHRPEEIFGYLGKKTSTQVLRRIFNPFLDCRVYQIFPNLNQLGEITNKSFNSEFDFINWYNPKVSQIGEPDYSLVPD
jgi:hypothetical protein